MKISTIAVKTPVGTMRRIGVLTPAGIVDATSARAAFLERSCGRETAQRVAVAQVPPDLLQVLSSGRVGLEWVQEAVDEVIQRGQEEGSSGERLLFRQDDVEVLAPIPRPPSIYLFSTWPEHIKDTDKAGVSLRFPDIDGDLRMYYKGNPDAVAGPNSTVPMPVYATEPDVECEMAAIIGLGGKDLTLDQARDAIAGYCVFNDVSFRSIQFREMQFGLGPTKGKDADGTNVMGPWLVTADEVGDPQALQMALRVNGEEKSSYNTRHMAWSFADLVSTLSRGQRLYPGQVLTSGCFPGGCGFDLGLKFKTGDVVELEIEKLGVLRNVLG
jgi:2-keto-4-pentenoate hydratase/2-oxohepta-3-ene-1,7-dioic acid hydratase in catechol pathway